MSDLRKLNRAVQNATFPSHDFAQAVREMFAEVAERMGGDRPSIAIDWETVCRNAIAASSQPKPAPPSEMPGRAGWSDDPDWIVDCAATELRRLAALSRYGIRNASEDWPETCAVRLEKMWRSHPAPALRMTEELEVVLRLAAQHVEGWQQTYQSPEYREQMLSAIAAVRQQASQPVKLEFPAVRQLVSKIRDWQSCAELAMHPSKLNELCFAALAELDAHEGKVTG